MRYTGDIPIFSSASAIANRSMVSIKYLEKSRPTSVNEEMIQGLLRIIPDFQDYSESFFAQLIVSKLVENLRFEKSALFDLSLCIAGGKTLRTFSGLLVSVVHL